MKRVCMLVVFVRTHRTENDLEKDGLLAVVATVV